MRCRTWIFPVALAVASVPLASTAVHADEKDEKHEKVIKLEDVPAPARQTMLREAGGSPILKVEQETEKGKLVYEAHVKKGESVIGIVVDASGKLLDKHSEDKEHEKK